MNSLPYLQELLVAVEDPYDPVEGSRYDFSGYYCLYNFYGPFQMVFCQKCGNYLMANTLATYECFVDSCSCTEFYPKTRCDWRDFSIQETYEKMKGVHQELFSYCMKKDMQKVTELVVGLKTNLQIDWV